MTMGNPDVTSEPFASPSALWQFCMETVSMLRHAGMAEAADTLETATKYVTSSGWEWLGELGLAARSIRERCDLKEPLGTRISRIEQTTKSKKPYA